MTMQTHSSTGVGTSPEMMREIDPVTALVNTRIGLFGAAANLLREYVDMLSDASETPATGEAVEAAQDAAPAGPTRTPNMGTTLKSMVLDDVDVIKELDERIEDEAHTGDTPALRLLKAQLDPEADRLSHLTDDAQRITEARDRLNAIERVDPVMPGSDQQSLPAAA